MDFFTWDSLDVYAMPDPLFGTSGCDDGAPATTSTSTDPMLYTPPECDPEGRAGESFLPYEHGVGLFFTDETNPFASLPQDPVLPRRDSAPDSADTTLQ